MKCTQCKKEFPAELIVWGLCAICVLRNRNSSLGLPEETSFQGEWLKDFYAQTIAYLKKKGKTIAMEKTIVKGTYICVLHYATECGRHEVGDIVDVESIEEDRNGNLRVFVKSGVPVNLLAFQHCFKWHEKGKFINDY